jgi:hypothetical protein
MLEGIKEMILKAPKSDKKEMLIDTIRYGLKVTSSFKKHLNTNDYLQALNFKYEGMYEIEKRRVKELEIKNNKLEKKIKEMLK